MSGRKPTIRFRTRPNGLVPSAQSVTAPTPEPPGGEEAAAKPQIGDPDYVGNRHPPRNRRFGQEGGNRSGRKKKVVDTDFDAVLERELSKLNPSKDAGKRIWSTSYEVLANRLVCAACDGAPTPTKEVIASILRRSTRRIANASGGADTAEHALDETDAAVLKWYADQARATTPDGDLDDGVDAYDCIDDAANTGTEEGEP